jgi:regulator of protease activity HflC (stomatin/prohibitin superfamily)
MSSLNIVGIALLVLLVVVIGVLAKSVRIVREYQRLVIFRLGKVIDTRGPGFVFLIPVLDKAVLIDLREFYLEIPHQSAITEDNASISIDFIVFNKVMDPQMSVVTVGNFAGAAQNIAATTLRSVVGDMSLDDVLAKREQMNEVLRVKLDEVTERWGVKVTNVEIREIIPPPQIQEAMTRQMSAERTRRAVVTEAEGSKQAAITVAEGNQQAAVLNAEGEKQAAILRAEGARQSAILNAEGFANALATINASAVAVGDNTMRLQYLDALKQMGTSSSSKVVVPMELTGLAGMVAALAKVGEGTAPAS